MARPIRPPPKIIYKKPSKKAFYIKFNKKKSKKEKEEGKMPQEK
jgi:hypothetical protein